MHGAEDGPELRQFNLANTGELVEYLLLLELQLFLVGQVLPLTASADTEVLTEGGRAYIIIYYKAYHLALGEGMLLTSDLHIAHVAGHAEGYKHHQIVPVEQTLPFGGNSLNRYALKER